MEHALLIIKPDTLERNLEREILDWLAWENFEVLDSRRVRLSVQEVLETHVEKRERYLAYMTRGDTLALLVRGDEVISRARFLKADIRKHFGTSGIENLIHTTEAGNEYERQMALFFPHADPRIYSGYADLFAKVEGADPKDRLIPELERLSISSTVRRLVLCVRWGDANRVQETIGKYSYPVALSLCTTVQHGDTTFILYLPPGTEIPDSLARRFDDNRMRSLEQLSEIKEALPVVVALGPVTCSRKITKGSISNLAPVGVDFVLTYTPLYSLEETDRIREVTLTSGLRMVGGSSGIVEPGRYTTSKEISDMLDEALNVASRTVSD